MQYVTGILSAALNGLHGALGSYGLAIIALTFLIRVVILPLTASQTRAMKKMQELQPEVQKLQKKHKKDPQRLNQETMALWREHKVNPLSGCLPVLIQLPVLWAFFTVLRDFDFRGDPGFLWIADLSVPDALYVLPVLAGLTTFWQTRMTTPTAAEGTQRMMLYFMPAFLGWLSMQFPAGLALYWVASNVFSIGQQYYLDWADRRDTAEGAA